jgi:hypothetical protein
LRPCRRAIRIRQPGRLSASPPGQRLIAEANSFASVAAHRPFDLRWRRGASHWRSGYGPHHQIDVIERLGGTSFIYGQTIDGETIIVEQRSNPKARVGETIEVGFRSDDARFFDENGFRIGLAASAAFFGWAASAGRQLIGSLRCQRMIASISLAS